MRTLISSILVTLLIAVLVIWGCSKTIIRNEVLMEEEQPKPRRVTQRDTTQRDDSLHEITFSPSVEAWVISDGDTVRVL